jgi:hypothetical protein
MSQPYNDPYGRKVLCVQLRLPCGASTYHRFYVTNLIQTVAIAITFVCNVDPDHATHRYFGQSTVHKLTFLFDKPF